MHEILFRGKSKNGGLWLCGDLRQWSETRKGICDYSLKHTIEVVLDTVGQYTGRHDKNGKQIFEGDIVKGLFLHGLEVLSVVDFEGGAFGLRWNRGGVSVFSAFTSICNVSFEVIGNSYDNPELLRGV